MKKLLAILLFLSLAVTPAFADRLTSDIGNASTINGLSVPASKTVVGTNSSGQIVDATSSVVPYTGATSNLDLVSNCLVMGGLTRCSVADSVANNGTITLPTLTSGWGGRCSIESGDDADAGEFSLASGGTARPIYSSAGLVYNLATASKVQVGAVSPANPLVVINASGGTLKIWVDCRFK